MTKQRASATPKEQVRLRQKPKEDAPLQRESYAKRGLDLKLTLSSSIRRWDVANPNLEEGHESKERAI
jgi:hypothetical protein